jgi:regulator of protease activity HflC (stomatin/prohibitin superfamily)
VPGCRTWGRSLGAARRHIREALATCVDVFGKDADRIAATADLIEDVQLPAAAKRLLQRAVAARRDAEDQAVKAQAEAIKAAKALTAKLGLSLRDAGELLGLSHERIKQLTDAA